MVFKGCKIETGFFEGNEKWFLKDAKLKRDSSKVKVFQTKLKVGGFFLWWADYAHRRDYVSVELELVILKGCKNLSRKTEGRWFLRTKFARRRNHVSIV
ncbi:hypothetical protein CEXT_30571 [Caerostris extrusa]|uniref:Uncharacterized protein n=1 Tax=Caerostris extrusa TaxID=172846 RepID=A0AAV4RG45_CAEEX|nr:hypothetical protein CEXT_30571 [Caerostris extrusa]